MVHETTEYRRKFRWNSSQKRYQIWKENRNFREARRLREFHHEPFPWEESDQSCNSSTDDAEHRHLPPSKLKQKHLDLIRITEAAKQKTEHKAALVESAPPSPDIHSPFPEKETCDVGVQTPNWELEDEKLPLQDSKLKEQELHEVSRRLKEEIAHSRGTLNLIEQIIKKDYSARPVLFEEKLPVPALKKFGTTVGICSLSPDKKQKFSQAKSHTRQSKVIDALNRNDVKVIKNVLHPSVPKFLKKSHDIPLQKQMNSKPERRTYKREGHRVINDLQKYQDDVASKWLSDYDNKNRFQVRSAPPHYRRQ